MNWTWVRPREVLAIAAALFASAAASAAPVRRLPVIDMHVHASRIETQVPIPICAGKDLADYPVFDPRDTPPPEKLADCAHPLLSETDTKQLRDATIRELRAHNVRRAVLSGRATLISEWAKAAPEIFITAARPAYLTPQDIAALRGLHKRGQADVFAELGAQYAGIRADDARLEPFWALAEELDVPVGIHLGEGIPGQAIAEIDRYRVGLTSPFQLEEVLIRHPRLRIYVMHAASPLTDQMIAMLFEYPTLYVDVAANDWNMPRAQFYDQLKRFVEAGFSKRILFGSDQGVWPQAIGLAIQTIEEAPFLTAQQKRDILYNNAARFLRLTKEQIARDHRQ